MTSALPKPDLLTASPRGALGAIDATEVTLLVADPETFVEVRSRVGSDRDVSVREAPGSAHRAVSSVRERLGGAPIGYVAVDAASELEALAAGADDTLVVPRSGSPPALEGFVARVRLRARLRGEQWALRAAAAHTEKLAALGVVVAGVAHEINNPSAAVMFSLEYLSRSLPPLVEVAARLEALAKAGSGADSAEVRRLAELAISRGPAAENLEVIGEISTAMRVIGDIVRDLRVFSRTGDDETNEVVDVHAVVDQVLRSLRGEIGAQALIERDFTSASPVVFLPRSRLVQVITNVLINASHAMRDIERPVHRLRISTRVDGEAVVVSISDTGPGIRPEVLERIFEPFYTTKARGVGTGLGLSVSREIAQRLGGALFAESELGEGSTFALLVPLAPASEVSRARAASLAPAVAPNRGRVLLVDDDERVLRSCARLLGESYDVLVASDGAEAIAMLESGSTADVVVTDVAMPDVGGRELHRWLLAERPALAAATIFVTAAVRADDVSDASDPSASVPVLEKPLEHDVLSKAVADCLRRREANRPA